MVNSLAGIVMNAKTSGGENNGSDKNMQRNLYVHCKLVCEEGDYATYTLVWTNGINVVRRIM